MSSETEALGQLGPYVLLKQIAVGGMAEIYLAKTQGVAGFEKLLCLKIIHPNYATDEHFVEMLIDEAKIAVGLNHGNIAQIFDLGRDDKTYFIAMEYIGGADLFKIMRSLSEKDADVPIDVAAYIAQEICTGLDYAHRKRDEQGRALGIVHRDISPQNILISYSGEVKIVDFGIAKAASRSRKTQAGVIKGKYYYMSPEQAWGDPIDQRTDIFSTGIILYEVLTGQMLYLEEDMQRLLDMVRKADIPRPSTKRAEIPPQLDNLVMKALAKRPADRWQTAHEFQATLTNFLFSYAPAFTPSRLTKLLEAAVGDETVAGRLAREETRPVEVSALMSRVDYRPQSDHSVLFRMSDLTPGASRSGDGTGTPDRGDDVFASYGQFTPNEGEEAEEARGERTQISGPPSMLPGARFQPVPALDTGGSWANEDEGPTLINRNAPLRPADLDLDATPAPEPWPRSIPAEVVVPAPAVGSGARAPRTTGRTPTVPPGTARTSGPPAPWPGLPARPPPVPPAIPAPPPAASWSGPGSAPMPPIPAVWQTPPPALHPLNWPPTPSRAAAPTQPEFPASSSSTGADAAQWPWNPGQPTPYGPRPAPPAPPAWPATGWPGGPLAPPLGNAALDALPEMLEAEAQRHKRRRRTLFAVVTVVALMGAVGTGAFFLLVGSGDEEGMVTITSYPGGASVLFDGKLLPKPTPVVVAVPDVKHEHTLELRLQNYEPYRYSFSFSPGEPRIQVPAALTPILGKLEVRSDPPEADVYVDGTHQGRTPVTVDKLTPTGEINVELRKRGYKPATKTLRWEGKRHLVSETTLSRSHP